MEKEGNHQQEQEVFNYKRMTLTQIEASVSANVSNFGLPKEEHPNYQAVSRNQDNAREYIVKYCKRTACGLFLDNAWRQDDAEFDTYRHRIALRIDGFQGTPEEASKTLIPELLQKFHKEDEESRTRFEEIQRARQQSEGHISEWRRLFAKTGKDERVVWGCLPETWKDPLGDPNRTDRPAKTPPSEEEFMNWVSDSLTSERMRAFTWEDAVKGKIEKTVRFYSFCADRGAIGRFISEGHNRHMAGEQLTKESIEALAENRLAPPVAFSKESDELLASCENEPPLMAEKAKDIYGALKRLFEHVDVKYDSKFTWGCCAFIYPPDRKPLQGRRKILAYAAGQYVSAISEAMKKPEEEEEVILTPEEAQMRGKWKGYRIRSLQEQAHERRVEDAITCAIKSEVIKDIENIAITWFGRMVEQMTRDLLAKGSVDKWIYIDTLSVWRNYHEELKDKMPEIIHRKMNKLIYAMTDHSPEDTVGWGGGWEDGFRVYL